MGLYFINKTAVSESYQYHVSVQSWNTEQRTTLQAQEHAQFPSSRSHFWGPYNDRGFVRLNSNDTKVKHSTYKERHHSIPFCSLKKILANLTTKTIFILTWNQCIKTKIPSKLISWPISSEKFGRAKNISKMKLHYQKGEKKTINFFLLFLRQWMDAQKHVIPNYN